MNPCAVLVGMQTAVATVENILILQLSFYPAIPPLGIYSKDPKTPIQKHYMHPCVHSSIIYNSQDL